MNSLFWKLFGLQLLAAAALLASALLVMRDYTTHNFSAFLEAQERERMSHVADDLARAYARSGDLAEAAEATLHRRPPDQREDGAGPPDDRRPPRRRPPSLRVLDLEGKVMAGYRHDPPPQGEISVPIEVSGQIVGYLGRPRMQGPPEEDERRFFEQQMRGLWVVGGCALVLAVLLSAVLTFIILRPVRRLSSGVTALAQRDFATRLDVASGDELGRLAADFNRLAEALERYDSRQRQWLADIAHELRTPLAILRGELEAVLDGVRQLDSAGARSLHQEVLRLGRLVDDLHLLSLAEAGGLKLRRVSTVLNELVREAAERFRERFQARGFQLLIEEGDAQIHLLLDPQRMDQLLANLLENALRHADPPGPVRIRIGVTGDQCQLRVSDGGPGVPDAALPKLFDRLYRTDAARSRVAGGSGLGLAICRSIVEAHDGRISARRAEGGGLAIEILLPLAGSA